jgi:histone acetyltransferase (RNA polymerase elongator complex component)
LLLPDEEHALDYLGLGKQTALIRELHVYGSLQSLIKKNTEDATQHV